jgi:hypothetical protein
MSEYDQLDRRITALESSFAKMHLANAEASPVRRCCSLPRVAPRVFDSSISSERQRLILSNDKKWVNGTTLKYIFMSDRYNDVVRRAFDLWQEHVGLQFEETSNFDDAEIRIDDVENNGSWSYIGRDCLTVPKDEATMNFGWDISADIDTVLHEIGHAIGLHHAHQNPFADFQWTDKPYEDLGGYPNHWDRETVDIATVREWYPKKHLNSSVLSFWELNRLWLDPGDDFHLTFIPVHTREYNFQTFGDSDTVMVLFNDQNVKMEADDDSGSSRNALIEGVRLIANQRYVLKVRLYWQRHKGDFAIIVS